MGFILAIAEDEVPSTGEPDPYMHVFLNAVSGDVRRSRGCGMERLNATHDPDFRSWIESANDRDSHFPVQNLPYGVSSARGSGARRAGVSAGDLASSARRVMSTKKSRRRRAAGLARPNMVKPSPMAMSASVSRWWSTKRRQPSARPFPAEASSIRKM